VVLEGVVARLSLALALIACSGACGGEAPPDARTAPPVAPAPEPPAVPDFPPETQSLRLTRTIAVRLTPGDDGKQTGTIAQDIRVGWTRTATARGCKRPWVEMVPRGWVCADFLEPSTKPPAGVELPRMARGEVVPGVYGKVTEAGATAFTLIEPGAPKGQKAKNGKPSDDREKVTSTTPDESGRLPDPGIPAIEPEGNRMEPGRPLLGSINVRKYAEITVGGRRYWKIAAHQNEYALASSIFEHKPSTFRGARLADDTGLTLPFAFVWPRWGGAKAYAYGSAKGQWPGRQIDARTAVQLLEEGKDAAGKTTAYRISANEWVMAGDLRLVAAAELPALVRRNERWIDVDLDNQIMVAYEGELPVYATLVTTGARDTASETGLWRIWKKVAETDMSGLSGEDPYAVATVPWTQFFSPEKGLALHAAYWHDKFGTPRSHGCINLAPVDARWLYFWSDPQVPPGWTMAAGVTEAPGSIVRVRSKATPQPEWKGYAIKVQEQRTEKP
jgi:hypothetical protein